MEPERPVVISTAADGRYLLTGLVVCEVCGRRADGTHWVHDRPGYRCRRGRTSASSAAPGRPKAVYWREDELLTRAGHQLAHDVPAGTDHRVTAAYLRARKLRIVSGHNTVTIRSDHPGPTPTAHTTNPRRRRKSPLWG
jgi:site-specific DNA recombinase